MCGICGIYGLADKALLKRMTQTMSHRGPDDHGYFVDAGIMLGQRRLSIIDLTSGKQPIFNEDESLVVVYNGEIYNYVELRAELEKKGHRFSTNSDTEVIVHAYEEYGLACLDKFNGMFALALYDRDQKQLLLARDRVGVKPLYYTHVDGKLVFGSEIKSIIEWKEVHRSVNAAAFHHFVNLRYVPQEQTMFNDINQLLPGHYLIANDQGVHIKKYWELSITENDRGEQYYLKQLDTLLDASVQRQLRSDVPVGVLLSSGLDSSILAAYAAKYTDNLKTFTMGFGEKSDECADATRIAEYLGTDHTNLIVEGNFLKDFKKLIWHMDVPKRNLYPYYLYKKMSEHVKVVISGLGGDELLGGYIFRYKYMLSANRFRKYFPTFGLARKTLRLPVKFLIKKYVELVHKRGNVVKDNYLDKLCLLQAAYDDAKTYYLVTTADSGFDETQLNLLFGKEVPKVDNPFGKLFKTPGVSLINRTYLAEFKEKLPNDFLAPDDRMSMAASVESRVPFFDNHLIDLCFQMPNKYKFDGVRGKLLLRKHHKKMIPPKLLPSGKKGFSSNTYSIYKNELRDVAIPKIMNGAAVKQGLINRKYIKAIDDQPLHSNKTRYYNLIWNLYAFELWHDLFLAE